MTRRMALISVLVVSLGSSEPAPAAAGRTPTKLTFMGWNIRGQGQNQTWDAARESIVAYLLESGADIIALQEARRAVVDMMADPALASRYDFYQTATDNPLLIDRSLPLTVSDDQPSGVGLCSEGTVFTIRVRSGESSFRLYNNHFCFDQRNATDGSDLVRAADPASAAQMVVAIGDLNTSPRFNPDTISNLLGSGFIDTWERTDNPETKPDVEWILVNAALLGDSLVSNTSADASCSAPTADGNCSDHRAFFVDIEFEAEFGLTVEPLERSFGEVEVGATKLRKVTITNHAKQDVDISAIKIRGSGRSQFILPARRDACSNTVLAPQQSCQFRVGFQPKATGPQRAKAVVNSNDPNSSKIRVKLSGAGATAADIAGRTRQSS